MSELKLRPPDFADFSLAIGTDKRAKKMKPIVLWSGNSVFKRVLSGWSSNPNFPSRFRESSRNERRGYSLRMT